MLIEYALGTGGFNYGILGQVLRGRGKYSIKAWNRGEVVLTGHIPLAKLHGSINRDITGYYSEGRRGITGRALIVAPRSEKRPPLELKADWDLAVKMLTSASKLIVFGFAFNPYDKAALNLLSDSGKNLSSVLLINRTSKENIAKVLWPKAKITSCPPPQDSFDCIEGWLRS
jgi:hypothetical protein